MLSTINESNSICFSENKAPTENSSPCSNNTEYSPRNRSDTGFTSISIEDATEKLQKDDNYLPEKTEMLDIDDAKKKFREYLYNFGVLDELQVGDKLAIVEKMYDIPKTVTVFCVILFLHHK